MNNNLLIGFVLTLLSASAQATDDLNTTPITYATIDSDYVLSGLGANLPISRSTGWNWPNAPGTPVALKYSFNNINSDTVGDFTSYEKDVIRNIMDQVDILTEITADEIQFDEIKFEDKIHIYFSPTNEKTNSPTLSANSCPGETVDFENCSFLGIYIVISADDLAMLDPTRESDESSWTIDYKHDMTQALSNITREILVGLGVQKTALEPDTPLLAEQDNQYFTVMSTNSGSLTSEVYAAERPKLYDAVYLQYMYGSNSSYNNDDTIYQFDDDLDIHQTIYDTGGSDTLNFSLTTRDSIIDLRPSSFSSIAPRPTGFYDPSVGGEHQNRSYNNLTILPDTYLEIVHAGSGDDAITGNMMANQLFGYDGDDLFEGKAGNDKIDGGVGEDTAIYALNFDDYTIQQVDGMVQITAQSSDEGIDSLTRIEYVQFADQLWQVYFPPNEAPIVELPAAVTVREGMAASITATATDADDDSLTYSWQVLSGPDVALGGVSTQQLSFTAPSISKDQTLQLQVSVSDSKAISTQVTSVLLTNNSAPTMSVISNREVDENSSFTITLNASDADSDDIAYAVSQISGIGVILSMSGNALLVTVPKVDSEQQIQIQVSASDYLEQTQQSFDVTIKNSTATVPDPVDNDSGGGGPIDFGLILLFISGILYRQKQNNNQTFQQRGVK